MNLSRREVLKGITIIPTSAYTLSKPLTSLFTNAKKDIIEKDIESAKLTSEQKRSIHKSTRKTALSLSAMTAFIIGSILRPGALLRDNYYKNIFEQTGDESLARTSTYHACTRRNFARSLLRGTAASTFIAPIISILKNASTEIEARENLADESKTEEQRVDDYVQSTEDYANQFSSDTLAITTTSLPFTTYYYHRDSAIREDAIEKCRELIDKSRKDFEQKGKLKIDLSFMKNLGYQIYLSEFFTDALRAVSESLHISIKNGDEEVNYLYCSDRGDAIAAQGPGFYQAGTDRKKRIDDIGLDCRNYEIEIVNFSRLKKLNLLH